MKYLMDLKYMSTFLSLLDRLEDSNLKLKPQNADKSISKVH